MKLANWHKVLDPEIRAKNVEALRLRAREALWTLRRPEQPSPVFVVGCSRSGTTVTFETLAASPALVSLGYEVPQFWNSLHGPHTNGWSSEAAGAEDARPEFRARALRYFYARLGPGRILDKTCINVLRIPFLASLFPEARFVFIHRDGRDNVSSMIDGWRDGRFALGQFLGPSPVPVEIEGGAFHEWHFFLPPGWRDFNRATLAQACAYQWCCANEMALNAGEALPPDRWIRIRYEDLFDRPVELFRDVFQRLDLPFTSELEVRCRGLDKRPTSIVSGPPARSKWRQRNAEAVESILDQIAPTMQRLGYLPEQDAA